MLYITRLTIELDFPPTPSGMTPKYTPPETNRQTRATMTGQLADRETGFLYSISSTSVSELVLPLCHDVNADLFAPG